MWLKIGIFAVAVITVLGGIYAAKEYVEAKDRKIEDLTAENTGLVVTVGALEQTVAAQSEAVDQWVAAQRRQEQVLQELQNASIAAQEERQRLNGLLTRHDLTDLSQRRPGLIEPRINAGTERAYRLFECATGAVHPDCPSGNSAP